MPTKQCIDCPQGLLKDTSEFYADRHSRRKDNLASLCKEHSKARRKKWMAKQAATKNAEYCQSAYYRNPEAYKDRARQWEKDNPEKFKLLRRQVQSTRRARKLDQFIEDVDPQIVYEMYGGMCGICKEFIEGDFHVDHRIPLSRGGMHGYINVQPAHPICNMKKGARVGV